MPRDDTNTRLCGLRQKFALERRNGVI